MSLSRSSLRHLPVEEAEVVESIINWIGRMAHKHGGTVYEKDVYLPLDWGQAIARECYGPDWNDIVPESPTRDDLHGAILWENGDVPNWVDTERMEESR